MRLFTLSGIKFLGNLSVYYWRFFQCSLKSKESRFNQLLESCA